ncbi:hypothetical protein L218DRAFT_1015983 [Marasmius fiardii PR-910]|nr:hypothetical protein L218DRAFT_1015983 [Marasmius fiardii PR-910]
MVRPSRIITENRGLNGTLNLVVVSAMLSVYEIIINLPAEIENIWMREWSFPTVLYIVQRYLPLVDTGALTLYHHFGSGLSAHYCKLNYTVIGWMGIGGIMLSEVLLTLRVWAVWNRRIPVAVGLVSLFVACWVPLLAVLGHFLSGMEFTTLPIPNALGCAVGGGNNLIYVCYVLTVVYDTVMFVMILYPGFAAFRWGGKSELIKTVYQDRAIYWGFIFCVSNQL